MSGFLCSMVGASFITVAAEVIRLKKGITAVGNAQVDTAQSKFGGASALFDGTGDYLAIANMTSANTFTFESWIRFTSLPTSGSFQMLVGSSSAQYFALANVSGSYFWELSVWTSGLSQYVVRFPATVSTNTWYHIATQKTGTTISLYQNGTSISSSATFNTLTTAMTVFDTTTRIGAWSNDAYSVNGHMDEVRISNSARYTADFTPSTTPFVNDANTLLLIHADGTDATTFFEDDNGVRASRSITASNNAQVDTAQSKFGGASALFDGTLDLLTCAMVGTGYTNTDLTIECWVRPAAVNQTKAIISNRSDDNTLPTGEFQLMLLDSSFSTKFQFAVGSNQVDMRSTTTYAANTWYHLAVTRNISTNGWTFYVNGTSEATATNATNLANNNIGIGAYLTGSITLNGHVDEIRISKIRRYTANFTAPSAAFVNDSDTLLLMHCDGTDATTVFTDDNGSRAQQGIQAIGNAQIDTAQSKFGGASALFDGTGDYLLLSYQPDFIFTGDFTIEFWWYQPSNVAAGIYPTLIAIGVLSQDGGWQVTTEPTTNKVNFITSANGSSGMSVLATTNNITAAAWHHIAVVRSSSVVKIYVDGTHSGSTTTTTGNPKTTAGNVYIGGGLGGLSSGTFSSNSATVVNLNGSLDEIRVSNTARYTANFTSPTAPFQNDANTLLLIHCDGTDGSTVFTDDNGVTPTHSY